MNQIEDIDLLKFRGVQQGQYCKPALDFDESLRDFARYGSKPSGDQLPWVKTQNDIDFLPGRTTIWAGLNKSGKSVIIGQALLGWMEQGAVIASLEMSPESTLHRMASQYCSKVPNADDCSRFLTSSPKLWIYNKMGAVDRDKILGLIYYSAEHLKAKHIVIDSLMKCGLGRDDYAEEKRFVENMVNAARDSGIHVHLICHMNKAGFDSADELIGARRYIRGAGEITDMVDACFVLSRNRAKELEMKKAEANHPYDPEIIDQYDAYLRLDANRHYGDENTYGLMFNRSSQSYFEDKQGAGA